MKAHPKFHNSDPKGIALIVVISLIVLLTLLVLAFLLIGSNSRNISATDVAKRQAEGISTAAKESIVQDLIAEMRAESTPQDVGNGQTVYLVDEAQAESMVPSKALKDSNLATDPNFLTLVKQSANSIPSHAGLAAKASNISTETPSLDGRFIAPTSWSDPSFFFGGVDLTAAQTPDWVYIDRSGNNPTTFGNVSVQSKDASGVPNPDYVVGRYAWQMYDLGGLLDANVALHDPADIAPGSAAKNSPYWAVASALPGAPADFAATIANWRNSQGRASAPVGSRLIEDWAEPKGWIEAFIGAAGFTDQAFLSRVDLLSFQANNSTDFPAALLPYFTHANFSLNQPALQPSPGRPLAQANTNDAVGFDNQINPSLLTQRANNPNFPVAGGGSVPVATTRFPLSRLNLLGASPANPALISQFFGLSGTSNDWTYNNTGINRLSAVANQGREPNFFEILKGVMHVGSLGVTGLTTSNLLDRSLDYHIIQLGANIIDQWDEDSFPTRIQFDGRTFYGIEDLPRIYYVRGVAYRSSVVPPSTWAGSEAPTPPPGTGTVYEVVALKQPVIWNPHQRSETTVARPTQFRAIAISNQASGSTAADVTYKVFNGAGGTTWEGLPTGPMNNFSAANGPDFEAAPGPQRWDETTAAITFEVPNGVLPTDPASFRDPYPLKSPNFPAGSNASGLEIYPLINDVELTMPGAENRSNQAIGFLVGRVWSGTNTFRLDPGITQDNGVRYELQYRRGGDWITYDEFNTPLNSAQERVAFGNPTGRHFQSFFRIDPRTNRLGAFSTTRFRGWLHNGGQWMWGNGTTAASSTDNGRFIGGSTPSTWEVTSGQVFPRFFQQNLPGQGGSYPDPDGIIRPGMGADASGVTGLPLADGQIDARPRILNRPFRSVAELGMVFRDIPWRQLDLSHPESMDGSLLDAFCLYADETDGYKSPRLMRGRINLNSAPTEVLASLFQSTSYSPDSTTATGAVISATEAQTLGQTMRNWVTGITPNGKPFRTKADLVGNTTGNVSTGFSSELSSVLSGDNGFIGAKRESALRAVVDSSDTRTWNLMIDLYSQSGKLTPSASNLSDFSVSAETRRWIFLSIDRFTGEIIHQSIEKANP